MKLTRETFGVTASGQEVERFLMAAENGMSASFLTLGAIWETMKVPGRDGQTADVILGFDDLPSYETNIPHFGSPIGRNANRIGGASFPLNGKVIPLADTGAGNNIHSGPNLYHRRMWEAADCGCDGERAFVTFRLVSPDGDQGFPGNLVMDITYSLSEDGSMEIHYHGVPDADTLVNFTNHCYFNLCGQEHPERAMDQLVTVYAEQFSVCNATGLATGELRDVAGTPFDFRTEKKLSRDIGEDCEQLRFGNGYDHNFVLPGTRGELKHAAVCRDEVGGRRMDVFTTEPGIQIYTYNMSKEREAMLPPGKGGTHYTFRSACCFETQIIPDAIHHPEFDQPVVKAGEAYDSKTIYRFSVQ